MADENITGRFKSIGWKATLDEARCVQYQARLKRCPVRAIGITQEQIQISEPKCLGCGFCARLCPTEAIKLKLMAPLKEGVLDYFKDNGLELKL